MASQHSRRSFLKSAAAVAASASAITFSGNAAAQSPERRGAGRGMRAGREITAEAIEREIRRRARAQVPAEILVADYYRIDTKIGYDLPVRRVDHPQLGVTTIANYPWQIWVTWAMEERICSLAAAAEWLNDEEARAACLRDLEALAEWPAYGENLLCAGHTGRMMSRAAAWPWVGEELRAKLKEGGRRLVAEVLPQVRKNYGENTTTAAILALENPATMLHNIRLIGTVGAALSARMSGDPALEELDRQVAAVMGAILEMRVRGHSEGVAYDGYILDFIADWLAGAPAEMRAAVLDHPRLKDYLDESYMIGAPGAAELVAPVGDVEPREMPFHLGAQAKLQTLQKDPVRAWHLSRLNLEWVPADGLIALREVAGDLAGAEAPAAGALDAHYVVALREGWSGDDPAVVISCTNSTMSHLPPDNGTILIGAHGQWILSDPGYQQYERGLERDFTYGPTAHNCPMINGVAQSIRAPKRLALERTGDGLLHTEIDLTACYAPEAKAKSVVRRVWLDAAKGIVVVADAVEGEALEKVAWHWHGNSEAAWWAADGAVRMTVGRDSLWVASPQIALAGANVKRLPGNTDMLSIVAEREGAAPVTWWVFTLGKKPAAVAAAPDAKALEVAGKRYSAQA